MTTCPCSEILHHFLAGDLPQTAAATVDEHVRSCAVCRRALDEISKDSDPRHRAPGTPPTLGETQETGLDRLPGALPSPGEPPTVNYGGVPRPPSLAFLGPPRRPGDLGTLGPYAVEAELGRGGMGVVFRAYDDDLQRTVALKVLRPELADEDGRERFVREAQAMAQIRHDHVVSVFAVVHGSAGLPFLVMEYLTGATLAELSRARHGLEPRQAAELCAQVADGLAAAHAAGLVHRDIKPGNIMLDTASRRPKILDFGLVKRLEASNGPTHHGAVVGTPSYMAPEQAAGGEQVGPAVDVYGVGALLYELLTGRPPFLGKDVLATLRQVLHDEPVPPRRLRLAVPRDLETVCLKALAKEPARRYPSAAALGEDLRRWLRGEPIQARPAGLGERAWRWGRRYPTRAALIGMTLLAALLSLAVFLTRQHMGKIQEQAVQQQHITRLTQELDAGMEGAAWDPQHLRQLESLLEDLHGLSPDQAAALRQKLHQRLAEVIRGSFAIASKPRIQPEDVPPIEEMIHLLDQRAPELAQTVRQQLQDRRRDLQLVFHLQHPFKEAKTLFKGRSFEEQDQGLILKSGRNNHDPVALSQTACTRNAEMEAIFQHPTWSLPGPIGLILHGNKDGGYRFSLEVAEPAEQDPSVPAAAPLTFAEILKNKGLVSLRIYRNKLRLLETQVPIAKVWTAREGRVRLWARQAGDQLTFQCNEVKVVFEDALPLSTKEGGVFGLYLSPGARILSVRAWDQNLPAAPSPLERGDELYAVGQLAEARLEYHAQAQTSTDPRLRQQAQYKEAICYLATHEDARAAEILESLAQTGTEERWQVLALCQLWGLRLRQNKDKEADVLFQALHLRQYRSELGLFLPDHVRSEILSHYRWHDSGLSFLLGRGSSVASRERALEVEEFLQTPPEQRQVARFHLFRVYDRAGLVDKAMRTALLLLKEDPFPLPRNQGWWFDLWGEWGYLWRRQKQAERALAELDQRLYQKPGSLRPACLPLLVERAILQVALGRSAEAEKDLDGLCRKPSEHPPPA